MHLIHKIVMLSKDEYTMHLINKILILTEH